MLRVRYALTQEEYVRIARYLVWRRFRVVAALFAVSFGLAIASGDGSWIVIAGVLLGITLVLVLLAPDLAWRRHGERLGVEREFDADDDGIATRTSLSTATMKWPLVGGVTRLRDAYVVTLLDSRRIILPVRAFASPGDEQLLRELVARGTGGRVAVSARRARS